MRAGTACGRGTCCTAGRPMQRSWPRADRQTSCWSPSASRKKCTLGRPARPCFSRSAPWQEPRAGGLRGGTSAFAACGNKRSTAHSAVSMWTDWVCMHRAARAGQREGQARGH